jgi:hypothetical protein
LISNPGEWIRLGIRRPVKGADNRGLNHMVVSRNGVIFANLSGFGTDRRADHHLGSQAGIDAGYRRNNNLSLRSALDFQSNAIVLNLDPGHSRGPDQTNQFTDLFKFQHNQPLHR